MKRASKLPTDAAPEPVAKGGKLTITGKLSRANWETLKYQAFAGQTVKLQYRKAGSAHYSTVKRRSGPEVAMLSERTDAVDAPQR
ncbi:hypothetical protein [Streptomyces antibioticus]|uniref:hypothetical protein n=1 Tax=Streptomyces antibioticus TaxID=1890 RepID=UPI003F4C64D0